MQRSSSLFGIINDDDDDDGGGGGGDGDGGGDYPMNCCSLVHLSSLRFAGDCVGYH